MATVSSPTVAGKAYPTAAQARWRQFRLQWHVLVRNKLQKAAVVYLEQINGVASASIRISPFWSGRLPTAVDNIKVEVR